MAKGWLDRSKFFGPQWSFWSWSLCSTSLRLGFRQQWHGVGLKSSRNSKVYFFLSVHLSKTFSATSARNVHVTLHCVKLKVTLAIWHAFEISGKSRFSWDLTSANGKPIVNKWATEPSWKDEPTGSHLVLIIPSYLITAGLLLIVPSIICIPGISLISFLKGVVSTARLCGCIS